MKRIERAAVLGLAALMAASQWTALPGGEEGQAARAYRDVMVYATTATSEVRYAAGLCVHSAPGHMEAREVQAILGEIVPVHRRFLSSIGAPERELIDVYLYPKPYRGKLDRAKHLLAKFDPQEVHCYWESFSDHGPLVHELVHQAAISLPCVRSGAEVPTFLKEGLAEYLAGDPWGIHHHAWVGVLAKLDVFRSVAELADDTVFRHANQTAAYMEASSFVRFLVEQGGIERLVDCYCGRSFEGVYGLDFERLEALWLDEVASVEISSEHEAMVAYRFWLAERTEQGPLPWAGLNWSEEAGVLEVSSIEPGSPAAAAGLSVGDVLVRIGSSEVRAAERWRILRDVQSLSPGENLHVVVERRGEELDFDITLGYGL